jgi:hypothetical protein
VALPLEKLGTTYPPRTALIDPDRARQYAAATNDHNPAYEAGKPESEPAGEDGARAARSAAPRAGSTALVAPPVFGVVPTWDCLGQAIELVPPEVAANVFPGNDVVTEVYEATALVTPTVEGASAYVFEASSQGAVVVKNGLAEVV